MTLLYITNSINASGGLERVLSIKSDYLIEQYGYEVYIVTLNNGHLNPFYKFNRHIKFHDISINGNIIMSFYKYFIGIKKLLKKLSPDVISVCDDGIKGLFFAFLFKPKNPVLYERHASINLNFKKTNNSKIDNFIYTLKHNLLINFAKKFNLFVVLTEGNKKDWPNIKCKVIANPSYIKGNNYEQNIKKEQIVLAVGSQSYNKGYDRLIDIWEIVNQKHPNWKLHIYGREMEDLKLQEKVNQLNLRDSLKFYKPIKNIEEKYKKASIYVMPSRSEGFGMVLIEAMAFRVPCIAFNCPHGPADIIENGKTGILIDNGDIVSFARAIIRLIDNKDERQKMGNLAQTSISRYAPENIMPLWNELFINLTKND